MTSLLRKKRRTTASPTTARGTAIKLAALALLGLTSAAGAADPAPPPFRAVAELPNAVLPPVPEPGTAPANTTPGRVVTFRKQAGEDRPRAPDTSRPDIAKGPEGENYVSLPSRTQAFRLDGDAAMEQRILKEIKKADRAENNFPPFPKLVADGVKYQAKTSDYPPIKTLVEPGFVVHRRLYFEEVNSERYGWDAGVLQPVVSTFLFYKDFLMWPGRLASNPHEHYDANAGKCLPGNPVPYYIYPPEIDIWGYAASASLFTGIGFLVPTP